jgi:hypothetical protein
MAQPYFVEWFNADMGQWICCLEMDRPAKSQESLLAEGWIRNAVCAVLPHMSSAKSGKYRVLDGSDVAVEFDWSGH